MQSDDEGSQERGSEDGQQKFIAHVPVPSQQEVGRPSCGGGRGRPRGGGWGGAGPGRVWVGAPPRAERPEPSRPAAGPQIEEALVRRKKTELLQRYASETLQAQSEDARRLLGY